MNREKQKSGTAKDEINREGARRYDEGVRKNARSGASERQAREAERALEGAEGDKMREAERVGKDATRHERR
jgi:hypothetical protein